MAITYRQAGVDIDAGDALVDRIARLAKPTRIPEVIADVDYFATGKLDVDVGEAVVRGIAEGCKQAGCALIGGETAELPGMYADGEYDLAGFAVGVVEKSAILDGSTIRAGDVVL